MSRAVAGATQPLAELLSDLQHGGVAAVSANGVLGDPAGASAPHGQTLLAVAIEALLEFLARWPTEVLAA
jgi:creatinine amidohydrolase